MSGFRVSGILVTRLRAATMVGQCFFVCLGPILCSFNCWGGALRPLRPLLINGSTHQEQIHQPAIEKDDAALLRVCRHVTSWHGWRNTSNRADVSPLQVFIQKTC